MLKPNCSRCLDESKLIPWEETNGNRNVLCPINIARATFTYKSEPLGHSHVAPYKNSNQRNKQTKDKDTNKLFSKLSFNIN
ncbi:hypothetical protein BLOT_006169 [Blomia tropicalis]|nr:hypothetical protein BLOT_006169 [Blomia tropicalis]